MADETIARKKYETKYTPPLERKESAPKLTEKQRRLWQALSEYIHEAGGWLVSAPGEKYLRVEIPHESPLPGKLLEFGYDVKATGIGTRIEAGTFMAVDTISFPLPLVK